MCQVQKELEQAPSLGPTLCGFEVLRGCKTSGKVIQIQIILQSLGGSDHLVRRLPRLRSKKRLSRVGGLSTKMGAPMRMGKHAGGMRDRCFG